MLLTLPLGFVGLIAVVVRFRLRKSPIGGGIGIEFEDEEVGELGYSGGMSSDKVDEGGCVLEEEALDESVRFVDVDEIDSPIISFSLTLALTKSFSS